MFLGVSGNVSGMDPTPYDRDRLAALISAEADARYDTAKEAYDGAGVNSGTWTRLVTGQSVKPFILKRVVKHFWPDARGSWEAVLKANPASLDESLSSADQSLRPPVVDEETGQSS